MSNGSKAETEYRMHPLIDFFVLWIAGAFFSWIPFLILEIPVRTFMRTTMFVRVHRKRLPEWPEVDREQAKEVLPMARERYLRSWSSFLPMGVFTLSFSLMGTIIGRTLSLVLEMSIGWLWAISSGAAFLVAFWPAHFLALRQIRKLLREEVSLLETAPR